MQGKVTAIGGVREKLVGALRAGVKHIIIPEENRKDVEELPENIRKNLSVNYVKTFHDALSVAFERKD